MTGQDVVGLLTVAGLLLGVAPALAVLGITTATRLAGAVGVGKKHRRRADVESLRPLLTRLAEGETEDALAAVDALAVLDAASWAVVESRVEELLLTLHGHTRSAVVELLARRGTLAHALGDSRSRSAARRAHGAEVLGAAGSRAAVRDVLRLLSDPEPHVRIAAVRALGRIRAPEAAVPLLASVSGPWRVPVDVVSTAVLALGVGAHHALGETLRTGDDRQRAVAAELAGRAGAVTAVDTLAALLQADPSVEVRRRCACALGRLASTPALAALLEATAACAPRTLRLDAVRALGDLGASAAVPTLAELSLGSDGDLAACAAQALLRCGSVGLRSLHDLAQLEDGVHAREVLARAPRREPASTRTAETPLARSA